MRFKSILISYTVNTKQTFHTYQTMSFARVFANIIIQGTAVFGKAFMQAYANAAANAGKVAADGAQAVVKRGQMTREEAIEILGVTADLLKSAPEEVQAKYDKFLEANDPTNGGSFYLQSKIFRAKEFLDEEERLQMEENEGISEESVEGMDGTKYTAEEGNDAESDAQSTEIDKKL
jgi:import inner membrane translocase subunit TIM16